MNFTKQNEAEQFSGGHVEVFSKALKAVQSHKVRLDIQPDTPTIDEEQAPFSPVPPEI